MVVDPIGLAGTIVTFVDFSCKILSNARELYNSSTGASMENDIIEEVAYNIDRIHDDLIARSTEAIPQSMRDLVQRCCQITRKLHVAIEKVRVKAPDKKWKSFKQALRSAWKDNYVKDLFEEVEKLRGEIQYGSQNILL